MGLLLLSSSGEAPISLEEVKARCRIAPEVCAFDADLIGMIPGVIAACERESGLYMAERTWKIVRAGFPADDEIELPIGPATSVEIQYLDASGAAQTLATASYVLDIVSTPPRVLLDPQYSWPATYDRDDAVRITFTTLGAPSAWPELKNAMLSLAAAWFENPADTAIPAGIAQTLRAYRMVRI